MTRRQREAATDDSDPGAGDPLANCSCLSWIPGFNAKKVHPGGVDLSGIEGPKASIGKGPAMPGDRPIRKQNSFSAAGARDQRREQLMHSTSGTLKQNSWLLLSMLSEGQRFEIATAFTMFDKNGNGKIEPHEILAVMEMLGLHPNREQAGRAAAAPRAHSPALVAAPHARTLSRCAGCSRRLRPPG